MRTTSKVSDELFIPSTIWNLESNKFIYNKLCHHWTDTLTPATCVQVHTGTYCTITYVCIVTMHVCYCTVCTCMYLYLQSTVQVHTVRIMCVQYLQSTMYSYILHVYMCVQYLQSTMHITQVMCSMYLQLHIGQEPHSIPIELA